jgi:predicted RNase H-like nuclease (RuvC/YqgF family)
MGELHKLNAAVQSRNDKIKELESELEGLRKHYATQREIDSRCISKLMEENKALWVARAAESDCCAIDRLRRDMVAAGVDCEAAGIAVGLVAQCAQRAYMQGYDRGYCAGIEKHNAKAHRSEMADIGGNDGTLHG